MDASGMVEPVYGPETKQRHCHTVRRTPDKIRKQNSRRRRRLGLKAVIVEVARGEIEFLRKRGYEVADDDKSIGNAVSAFLGDSAFEG